MTDGPDYNNASTLEKAILEVLSSDAFAEPLAIAIAKALGKGGIEASRYPKKCRCARCCPPPVSCPPPLPVMWIPILNPFWWAQACQPRCGPHHCGPRIPESCHEYPQTPPPRHPGGIG